MSTIIDEKPNEKAGILFDFQFTDDTGTVDISAAISAKFQLTQNDGTIVNDRSFLLSDIPENGQIFLYGDDLQLFTGEDCGKRKLAIDVIYNTTIGGIDYDNAAITEEFVFYIENITSII